MFKLKKFINPIKTIYHSQFSGKYVSFANFCSESQGIEKFKFFYGQGGKLNFKSDLKCNVALETIWEDYSTVSVHNVLPGQENAVYGWEEEDLATILIEKAENTDYPENQVFESIIELPDIYDYNIETIGDVIHRKAKQDPKQQGDIKVNIKSQNGIFEAAKVAGQTVNIKTINGLIKFKILDVQDGTFENQSGDIFIKRLAVTNSLKIQNLDGKITFGGCYTLSNHYPNSCIQINGQKTETILGFANGSFNVNLEEGYLFIQLLDANKVNLKAKKVQLNINSLLQDSVIEADQIDIYSTTRFEEANIVYQQPNKELIYKVGSKDNGKPTLILKGENINFSEKPIPDQI